MTGCKEEERINKPTSIQRVDQLLSATLRTVCLTDSEGCELLLFNTETFYNNLIIWFIQLLY